MRAAVAAHIEAQRRLRAFVVTGLEARWRTLPAYDEENVPAWLRAARPIVGGAQRQSAYYTSAFLASVAGEPAIPPNLAAVTGAAVRAGAELDEVYRRPFVTLWTKLGEGTAYDDALAAGLARATSSGATDVQLTMRATLADIGERSERIDGYQRIPDGNACELCLLASTQRYRTGDLMPIHNGCGCGVDVILSDFDPKPEVEPDRLAEMADSGLEITVREHGELGPVLANAAHSFEQL